MSLNRNLRNAAQIAGCVVLLASCGDGYQWAIATRGEFPAG